MFKLRMDAVIHEQYAGLPADARRDLASCLVDALADPLEHSLPYGEPDSIMRTIGRGRVAGVILIGPDTVTLVQITHAG